MPDGSSRIDRSGEPSAVAATLTELSPGQERLKSVSHIKWSLQNEFSVIYSNININKSGHFDIIYRLEYCATSKEYHQAI